MELTDGSRKEPRIRKLVAGPFSVVAVSSGSTRSVQRVSIAIRDAASVGSIYVAKRARASSGQSLTDTTHLRPSYRSAAGGFTRPPPSVSSTTLSSRPRGGRGERDEAARREREPIMRLYDSALSQHRHASYAHRTAAVLDLI
ncbi:hypothetical protein PUN28_004064 [Cardiocondyla obscurior]|uniref:Uncharacterized protein n=1 Tax=Cardiocondyla obscurior TaxID=286306 RepID=A0AAW2GNY4_9HYME